MKIDDLQNYEFRMFSKQHRGETLEFVSLSTTKGILGQRIRRDPPWNNPGDKRPEVDAKMRIVEQMKRSGAEPLVLKNDAVHCGGAG